MFYVESRMCTNFFGTDIFLFYGEHTHYLFSQTRISTVRTRGKELDAILELMTRSYFRTAE